MWKPMLLILALIFIAGCGGNETTFTERRDQMAQDIEARIAAIDERVNELQNETSDASRERIDELQDMRNALEHHLESMADQTADTWDSLSESVQGTLDEVGDFFENPSI